MFGSVWDARGDICIVRGSCRALSQWLPMRNGISRKSSCKIRRAGNAASTPTKSCPTGSRPLTLYRTWARNYRCILERRCDCCMYDKHATLTPINPPSVLCIARPPIIPRTPNPEPRRPPWLAFVPFLTFICAMRHSCTSWRIAVKVTARTTQIRLSADKAPDVNKSIVILVYK